MKNSILIGMSKTNLLIQKPAPVNQNKSNAENSNLFLLQNDKLPVDKIQSSRQTIIQPKLEVNQLDDQYENEAGSVADKIMLMPDVSAKEKVQTKPIAENISPLIQTSISGVSEELMSNSNLENQINNSKNNGNPLPENTRTFMESRFGANFSNVKIHTDSNAVQMNRELNAHAFTYGSDIYFNRGKFNPENSSGKHLLAHELTHVIQQKKINNIQGKIIQCTPNPQTKKVPKKIDTIDVKPTSQVNLIRAEDVSNIIASHLQVWYFAMLNGIEHASLSGNDEALKWFLIALGGNLVWAATAFVDPAASFAIKAMSVGGAVVGSGTLEKLAQEDLPIDEFRKMAGRSLSKSYSNFIDDKAHLITELENVYYEGGLTNRDDANQCEERRHVGWNFLFRENFGYNDPYRIETNSKNDIESIWSIFSDYYKSLFTIITPNFIRDNLPKYILVNYYRALVASGVADRTIGVRKIRVSGISTTMKDRYTQGMKYEFPGGATALKTNSDQHVWWGNITADVP